MIHTKKNRKGSLILFILKCSILFGSFVLIQCTEMKEIKVFRFVTQVL